jgi:hypothetical protein
LRLGLSAPKQGSRGDAVDILGGLRVGEDRCRDVEFVGDTLGS